MRWLRAYFFVDLKLSQNPLYAYYCQSLQYCEPRLFSIIDKGITVLEKLWNPGTQRQLTRQTITLARYQDYISIYAFYFLQLLILACFFTIFFHPSKTAIQVAESSGFFFTTFLPENFYFLYLFIMINPGYGSSWYYLI